MPMITMRGKGQLTVPGILRRELHLNSGDVLEATVEKGRLVMIPKTVVDKETLIKEMSDVLSKPVEGRFADMSEDEIMATAIQIIDEDRKKSPTA